MRLLLDTQTFLWFILADPRLSVTALGLITDPLNHKHLSPASYWEIAIKTARNLLQRASLALPECFTCPRTALIQPWGARDASCLHAHRADIGRSTFPRGSELGVPLFHHPRQRLYSD